MTYSNMAVPKRGRDAQRSGTSTPLLHLRLGSRARLALPARQSKHPSQRSTQQTGVCMPIMMRRGLKRHPKPPRPKTSVLCGGNSVARLQRVRHKNFFRDDDTFEEGIWKQTLLASAAAREISHDTASYGLRLLHTSKSQPWSAEYK